MSGLEAHTAGTVRESAADTGRKAAAGAGGGRAVAGALAAEWHKLRTVRSTAAVVASIGAGLLLGLLWSVYATRYWDGLSPQDRAGMGVAPPTQLLAAVLPVCGVVLGALTLTSEYATGMIRTTMAVLPRRLPLLGAKALAAAGLIAGAGLVSLVAALLAGRLIAGDRAVPGFAGPLAEHLAYVLTVALHAAAITLMTLGFAAVVRSTAAAITTGMALLFVVPPLARLLPAPWDDRLWWLMPAGFPNQIAPVPGSTAGEGGMPPPVAAAVLTGYVVVMLAAGAFVFARRDA